MDDDTRNKVQLIYLVVKELYQVPPLGCVLDSQLETSLVGVRSVSLGLNTDGDRVSTETCMAGMVDGGVVELGAYLVDKLVGLKIAVMLGVDAEDIVHLLALSIADQVRRLDSSTGTASQVRCLEREAESQRGHTKV